MKKNHKRIAVIMAAMLAVTTVAAPASVFAHEPSAAIATAVRADVQATNVQVNETNFPDAKFRDWIKKNVTSNSDTLTADQINKTVEMNLSGQGISNLKGIEHFTALWWLDCSNNQLTTLDLSKNTKLYDLNCSGNQLTTLTLTGLIELQNLDCRNNRLTSLDFSGNTALAALHAGSNQLSTLNVASNTKLEVLDVQSNQLMGLSVGASTNLKIVRVNNNKLIYLNLPSASLTEFKAENQQNNTIAAKDGSIDLNTIAPGITSGKITVSSGGTVSGTTLNGLKAGTPVVYTYDCGAGKSLTVTLNVSSTSDSDQPGVVTQEYYSIENAGRAVDMQDVRYEDGVQAVPWYFSNQNNQVFAFEQLSDSYYKIVAVHSKKALTMQSDYTVVQKHFTGSENSQKWKMEKGSDGRYTLTNVQYNRKLQLDANGVTGVTGNATVTLEKRDAEQPISAIAGVEDGVYEIQSAASSLYIGTENNSIADGDKITQQSKNDQNSQKWVVKNHKDGQVYITSANSQKMLDLDMPTKMCFQWVDGYNLNQRWHVLETGTAGEYLVKNAASATMLAVTDSNQGSQLTATAESSTDHNQKWKFSYVTAGEEKNKLENGYYTIGNEGVVVDIKDVLYDEGVQAVSWYFGEQNNQLFEFTKLTDGNYKIVAVHSKKALTMEANGTVTQKHFRENDSNQKWEVTRDLDGNTYLKNVGRSKLMTVTRGSGVNSAATRFATTKLQLELKKGLQPIVQVAGIENGTYQIQSVSDSSYVVTEGNSSANGTKVVKSTSGNNQKWTVTNFKNGPTHITLQNGYMLDLDVPTSKVNLYSDGWNVNQRWWIEPNGGNYLVRNALNGKMLALPTGSDTQLTGADKNTNDTNQQWKFVYQ